MQAVARATVPPPKTVGNGGRGRWGMSTMIVGKAVVNEGACGEAPSAQGRRWRGVVLKGELLDVGSF